MSLQVNIGRAIYMPNDLLNSLSRFMLTNENINLYTKSNISNLPNRCIFSDNIKSSDPIMDLNDGLEKCVEKGLEKGLEKCVEKGLEKGLEKGVEKCVEKCLKKPSNPFFISSMEDPLFWNFYTILFGQHKYELDGNFKNEKKFKIDSVELLKKKRGELKAMKLSLNDIGNELVYEKKITIKGLMALAFLYNVNILYVKKNMYYEMINDMDKMINLIVNEDNQEKLFLNEETSKMDYYRENKYYVENIAKPVKAIGSYVKNDLIEMATKLKISDLDKANKTDIYNAIRAILD